MIAAGRDGRDMPGQGVPFAGKVAPELVPVELAAALLNQVTCDQEQVGIVLGHVVDGCLEAVGLIYRVEAVVRVLVRLELVAANMQSAGAPRNGFLGGFGF